MKYNELLNCIRNNQFGDDFIVELMINLTANNLTIEQKTALIIYLDNCKLNHSAINAMVNYLLENARFNHGIHNEIMDVCGTGGDGKNTINISTLTALVLASCGVKIAKHGNYGFSSGNGSSSVLEFFGYKFKNSYNQIVNEINESGIVFIHAPIFHPVLKEVGQIRKNLKSRTFFNNIGPMLNPLQPKFRFTGVNNHYVANLYKYVYDNNEKIKYNIVLSNDGNDEITLTSSVKLITNEFEKLIYPNQLSDYAIVQNDVIHNGTLCDAAKLFYQFLKNESSPLIKEVVLVNAAKALQLYKNIPYYDAKLICKESVESFKTFELAKKILIF